MLGIGMPAESRASVPPKYELIEIDIIGFEPDADTQGRFGINNRGEIAYTRLVHSQYRAMLWLPADAYGISTASTPIVDLVDFFGVTPIDPEAQGFLTGSSYARDISDSGFIVGQFEGTERFEGTAFVIDLADHMSWTGRRFSWKPAALISPCTSIWARAMAVTGDVNPAVVIEVGVAAQCLFGQCAQDTGSAKCFAMAGLLEGLGNSPQWTSVGTFPCGDQTNTHPSTLSFDAERLKATGEILLAGSASRLLNDPLTPCAVTADAECDEPTTAIRWDPTGTVLGELTQMQLGPVARGINLAGEAVGYGYVEGSTMGTCFWSAALWPAASTQPLNLHTFVSSVADESRAESINREGVLSQIVGWDPRNDQPLLWTRDGSGTWHGWVLQVGGGVDDPVIDCDDCDVVGEVVTLRQAFDVNDEGWIIVWGERGNPFDPNIGSSAYRLYLLKPIDVCGREGDIDQSGDVNLVDLLLLLAAWGDCAAAWCPEDLNGDGQVNFEDLLLLVGNWGSCAGEPTGLPQSVEDCIQRVGLDPVALSACLTTIP